MNEPTPTDKPRARHRGNPYQRAQERRIAQKKADARFYNGIFGIISACVLVVLGLAMIASSGNVPQIGGGETLTQNTFLGMTMLEIGGLVVVAIIAFIMWRRITKR
jgi:Na+/proline symporter